MNLNLSIGKFRDPLDGKLKSPEIERAWRVPNSMFVISFENWDYYFIEIKIGK